MIRKYAQARWAFAIGLVIFMVSAYFFFRPQPPVQANSNLQPAEVNHTDETTVESNLMANATSTSAPIKATSTSAHKSTPESRVPTQNTSMSPSVDRVILSLTLTPQNQITPRPLETTAEVSAMPVPVEVTPEVTFATITTQTATTEATAEATLETDVTPVVSITGTPTVINTTSPVNITREVTSAINPFALLAISDAVEPDVELAVTCPSQEVASFMLRNVGGDMPAPGTYTVNNPPQNQSFHLDAGESISFQEPGDAFVTAEYTTTTGTRVTLGATGQCKGVPTATTAPSPTRTATRTTSMTPAASNTPTITRTPGIAPTRTITFTPSKTSKPTLTLTASSTASPTITLTVSKTPTATLTFTPSRTARPTKTFTPSSTPTTTLTPSITATPSVTFTPSIVPSATATATLQPGTTLIELNVACLPGSPSQARFQLKDVGGDMLTAGTYTLKEPNKPLQTKSFLLLAGKAEGFVAAGDAQVKVAYRTLTFSSVTLGVTGTCLIPKTPTPTPTRFLPSSTPSLQSTTTPTSVPITRTSTPAPVVTPISAGNCGAANDNPDNTFPIVDTTACTPNATILPRAVWTPITVGGAICPDWLIYNTNMTGDWEIFRLGQLPGGIQADPNLSRGVGRRVYDLMPSRSPDSKWITFASNRDSNWEIYISAVEQSDIQRVTYTPDAVELDPVWSPIGDQLIYESNRDGNWNLYLFDVGTGVERRLTDWAGNEINAAWSPDGQHIVFQSDGEGLWQIYEMDVNSLVSHRLSDGIADGHGPQYSRDGQHIVFHSLQQNNNNIIYIMNADGSHLTAISDPAGNAINHAWSPDNHFIAYQSNIDGDQDIYIYEVATQTTRKLTGNTINDYAPTWYCNAPVVAFTSDITGDSNIFSVGVLPIKNQPINVRQAANQLTFDFASDQYPVESPSEENASRQDSLPVPVKNK